MLPGKAVTVAPFKTLPKHFDDLIETFKKKKRYNLRAGVRKTLNAGAEMITSSDKGTHAAFFKNLCRLHKKRVEEKALDSSFVGLRVEQFHLDLLSGTDNARFYGLQLDNKVIAVIYGYEFCNHFYYYQVAHDPDFKDLSPGSVLLYLVIEDCCSRGMAEFNFLQGNESYKRIWTDQSRMLYRAVLSRGNFRSTILNALDQGKKVVSGFLKRATHGH